MRRGAANGSAACAYIEPDFRPSARPWQFPESLVEFETACGVTGQRLHQMWHPQGGQEDRRDPPSVTVSRCGDKRNKPLSWPDNGLHEERAKGFEPSTSSLGS
jgi:hypothetical protein